MSPAIGPTEVQVDLGCQAGGLYSLWTSCPHDPNVKPEDVVKVGDEIETYIIRVNDVEGYAMLSKKRLDAVKVWEDIEKAREDKTARRRQRHRGEQGRHRCQRQGRARVRSRFPVRPAPRR